MNLSQLVFSILSFFSQLFPSSQIPTSDLAPSPHEQTPTVTFKDIQYQYASYRVKDLSKLSLHSNLPQKKTALELKTVHNCSFFSSSGFYDVDDKPLGLIVYQDQTISKNVTSALLNGYLIINQNQPLITPSKPQTPLHIAAQSGPLLIENRSLKKLVINNDSPRRRVLAAIDTQNQLYFFYISEYQSTLLGPQLTHLPQLLLRISKDLNLEFESAINLDGGRASAFISPSTQYLEITSIGSFFCEKP